MRQKLLATALLEMCYVWIRGVYVAFGILCYCFPHWSVKGLVVGWHADVVQLVLCCNIKCVCVGVTIRPHIPDQHFIPFCLNA